MYHTITCVDSGVAATLSFALDPKTCRFEFDEDIVSNDTINFFRRIRSFTKGTEIQLELKLPSEADIAAAKISEPVLEFFYDIPIEDLSEPSETEVMRHIAERSTITMTETLPIIESTEEMYVEDQLSPDWLMRSVTFFGELEDRERIPVEEPEVPELMMEEVPREEILEEEVPGEEILEEEVPREEFLEEEVPREESLPEREVETVDVPEEPVHEEQAEVPTAEEEEREPAELQLPELEPITRRTRRKKKVVIDKKKQLSRTQMRSQLSKVSIDGVQPLEEYMEKKKKIPAEILLRRPGSRILSEKLLKPWELVQTMKMPDEEELPEDIPEEEVEEPTLAPARLIDEAPPLPEMEEVLPPEELEEEEILPLEELEEQVSREAPPTEVPRERQITEEISEMTISGLLQAFLLGVSCR